MLLNERNAIYAEADITVTIDKLDKAKILQAIIKSLESLNKLMNEIKEIKIDLKDNSYKIFINDDIEKILINSIEKILSRLEFL